MNALFLFFMLYFSYNPPTTHSYKYFSLKNCDGHEENGYYDITCNGLTQFPQDLPILTERLELVCSRSANSSMSAIELSDMARYHSLISITISSCPINQLSERLFSNLIYLNSVTLDNLPLRHLENIFFKTTNIIELSLTNLKNLEYIDSQILVHQSQFSKIHLKNVTISATVLHKVLLPVQNSIREFSWTNVNSQPLSINVEFFTEYKLGFLDLSNNLLANWDFLNNTKARKLLLSNTKSVNGKFMFSSYLIFSQSSQVLDLENIGMSGMFPESISKPLLFLKTLSIKGNLVDSLHNDIDRMLPNLDSFDVSLNKIIHLQSKLNNLFYRTNYFKIEGNPLHCNCEIRWLFARYKFKIRDFPRCYFGFKKSESLNSTRSLKNMYFSQLSTDNLACFPPLPPVLSISKGLKPSAILVNYADQLMKSSRINKEYTVVMEPHQQVDLSCETLGDPVPTLTWSNKGGTVLNRSVPNGTMVSSPISKVTVGLAPSEKKSVYMCTASNTEGVSFALVNIISTKIKEPEETNLSKTSNGNELAKVYSGNFAQPVNVEMHIVYYFLFVIGTITYFGY